MSNTQRLGSQWKGRAWDDGEPIPRVTLPDGTLAEAMASLGYGWDGSAFVKLNVDSGTGGLKVYLTNGGSGGTSSADGTAWTAGTSTGTPLMGARDDTASAVVAEDKLGVARITTARALHVNLRDATGTEVAVGGGTQYTEDAAAVADPVGTVPILVRKDTPAATVSTDGDNIAQRGTNFGAGYVTLLDTSGNPVSVGGGTQYVEDVASVGGESMTLAGAIRQDAPVGTTSLDGDYANLKTDSVGRLWVNASGAAVPITDNGGLISIDDGAGSITVDGTVSVSGTTTVSGTVDTELTTADLDTGAGVDTRAVVGLAGAASGGAVLVQATSGGAVKADITTIAGTAPTTVGKLDVKGVDGDVFVRQTTSTNLNARVDNAGTFAVQDSEKVADNAGFTDGTTKVQPIGYIFDEVAGTALTENDIAAARLDSKRAQVLVIEDETTRGRRTTVTAANALKVDGSAVTQPVSVAATLKANIEPETSGGLTAFHLESAASTNATSVKASAGQLYGYYVYNSNAAARKVAFHNTAGTPTAGASIFFTIVIPAGSAANVEFSNGIAFGTGIGITTVTGLADADATAVAADDLNINLFYK